MTTTINAQATNGLLTTADGSGIVKLQSNGVATNSLVWINFGYSSSLTTKSSYNVSSTTRNGTGDYTFAFSNNLSDANYATVTGFGDPSASGSTFIRMDQSNSIVSSCRFLATSTTAVQDVARVNVVVFGN